MDSRERALEELKRRIAEQRAKLDPQLLNLARKAALSVARSSENGETVPYDRDAATQAVRMFLERHGDPKEFERKLAEFIARSRH